MQETHAHQAADDAAIAPQFDRASILKMLRFAFGKRDTVVAELLQNGRRAGATRIDVTYEEAEKRLTVKDNGSGLADLSKLIDFCSSGWNAEVQKCDQPFGVGFLSAFYAGSVVTFASKGRQVRFDTARMLEAGNDDVAFNPEVSEVTEGSEVTLEGFEWADWSKRFAEMTTGFAIPVTLNGVEMARQDAVSEEFIDCAVGKVKFNRKIPRAVHKNDLRVYLQGFRVHGEAWRDVGAVIHLDGERFVGKFPDRDRVIDQDAAIAACEAAVREAVERQLLQAKKEKVSLTFLLDHYKQAESVSRLDVFNDVMELPASWFAQIHGTPGYSAEAHSMNLKELAWDRTSVTREEIREGSLLAALMEDFDYGDQNNVNAWNLVNACGAAVLTKHLHAEHWFVSDAQISCEEPVEVEVKGEEIDRRQRMEGTQVFMSVTPCESVTISNGKVQGSAKTMVVVDGDCLIPKGANTSDREVLLQADSYCDEWGSELEADFEHDLALLESAIQAAMEPDGAKRLLLKVQEAVRRIDPGDVRTGILVKPNAQGLLEVCMAD